MPTTRAGRNFMKQSTRNILLQVVTGSMIIVLLLWQGLRERTVEADSGVRQTMGTFARVLVVAPDNASARAAIAAAVETFERAERLMSDHDPASQLSEVNRRAFDEPVVVDAEVFAVLAAAVRYSRLSEGAFDVTVGPVVQLWRQAKRDGALPTAEQIAAAGATVGYGNLMLDAESRTVRFAVEGMALDLGGIAKGYAIDRAVEAMRQAGATGGMVDVGGDLVCFGTPVGGRDRWRIGLQDPGDEGNLLLRLAIDGHAVATSGDYRRFTVLNGQKHSHIVNPVTADSAAGLSSVTIIAQSAMEADALATAVSVLGHEKGLALIELLDNVEAIIIRSDAPNEWRATSGAETYIQKK